MSDTPLPKVAFLGLGAMGSRMALKLLEAGYAMTVWNRDAAKADLLGQKGAAFAVSPRAAAEDADLVFSMITDDNAARHVWLDPANGAVNGLKHGAIAIESSTVTPAWIKELDHAVSARGAALLDAPVAGSRPQAEAGQLVFMIGGSADAFESVKPHLAPLSAAVMHVGGTGKGAVLKLAVNTLFAAQLASIAELLGFLSRNGIEAEQAADLLARFPIVAPPIGGAARMMAAKNLAPMFTIDLIEKDLGYIIDSGEASGAALPLAAGVRDAFRKAQAIGLGHVNISGLASVYA